VGENYVKKTMSNGKCQLTMGQETMAFMNLFMAVPKNSPYVQELNKEYVLSIITTTLFNGYCILLNMIIDRFGGIHWVCKRTG